MKDDELRNIFSYHAPTPEQQQHYVILRDTAYGFAREINLRCPESREKSLAITKLQEVVMFANAAIAIHGGS